MKLTNSDYLEAFTLPAFNKTIKIPPVVSHAMRSLVKQGKFLTEDEAFLNAAVLFLSEHHSSVWREATESFTKNHRILRHATRQARAH